MCELVEEKRMQRFKMEFKKEIQTEGKVNLQGMSKLIRSLNATFNNNVCDVIVFRTAKL